MCVTADVATRNGWCLVVNMETSAKAYVALTKQPLVAKSYELERTVIEKYMSDLTEDSAVIDMACGPGYATNHVNIHYGCRVLGVDIMPDMIKHAQKMYGKEKAEFIVGDVCDPKLLDERKESFHWVMCHLGIHFIKDTDAFLENVNKMLRENGQFLNVFVTREFGDPIYVGSVRKTIGDPKWKEYKAAIESTMDVPLLTHKPEEKYPWIKDNNVLLGLMETKGFGIKAKEICFEVVSLPLSPAFITAIFSAVKMVPEQRREEFLGDVMAAARTLSGEADPMVNLHIAVIVAQKMKK